MAYLEFEIPARSWSSSEKEILVARMSQIGFEGFVELEDRIQAYIQEDHYSADAWSVLVEELSGHGLKVQYRYHETPDQNWNEEWEKKFQPVMVADTVLIRAPFHDPASDLPFTIIIEPKMSFGTGHHITTRLMILEMMRRNLDNKRILDMGCGTGVLGIFACLNGASRVLAVDNDQWAFENALENRNRNEASVMEVRLGDKGVLGEEMFDLVLANITRNTLVSDMPAYFSHLVGGGHLIVSGILAEDVQYVLNAAYDSGLSHLNTREDSNWISLSFVKS